MPRIIFERYHSGYFMPFAMRNPRRFFFILGCVLKLEAVEGRFKRDNVDFFLLVDERILGSKAFMIIDNFKFTTSFLRGSQ